jgi:hypothetical protein
VAKTTTATTTNNLVFMVQKSRGFKGLTMISPKPEVHGVKPYCILMSGKYINVNGHPPQVLSLFSHPPARHVANFRHASAN